MRITADIIEDESFLAAKEAPDSHNEVLPNGFNALFINNDGLVNHNAVPPNRLNVFSLTDNVRDSRHAYHRTLNTLQHARTVQEVTDRFSDLHLSDMMPSSSHHSNPSRLATGSNKQSLNEPMDHPKIEESPPLWLQQWMIKMKSEIKKEILEEILNIPSEFKQIHIPDTQNAKNSLVGKEESNVQYQGEVVHSGIYCDNCDQLIHGIRYKCGNCSDFDLCQECESLPNVHNKNHIFLKIRYPFALKLYQKQKWQELMSPMPIKPARFNDATFSKCQSKKLYEAKFICDETVPDSTVIQPSTRFVKSWKVMNSGTRVWSHATKLHLIQGSPELVPISQKVDVPHLKPGEEGIVSVLFTSPSTPGVYRSHWNFCHKSRPFGHIVWCHIIVKSFDEESTVRQSGMKELPENLGNKQVEVSNIAQVLTAVKEEHEAENMVPRKLVVNSHTATPNNTPFALTPPKSPDHESLTKSVCEMAADKTFLSHHHDSDEDDVVSISSESDTEFVVIPMPKCFNLSESFVSQHLRFSQNLTETENSSSSEEAREGSCTNFIVRKSTPVSQETGVPELSENTCEPYFTVLEERDSAEKIYRLPHPTSGESSSEISIIESENVSPVTESASQTFDSLNMTLSTNLSSSTEIERVEVRLSNNATANDYATASTEVLINTGIQEQKDIPCNTTFPKFPVEGVTNEIYERPTSTNINTEERTIQVLPEGLVIGALSAAASVYNTAKAVISTIQQPKTENEGGLAQPARLMPDIRQSTLTQTDKLNPMDQLIEMGFCNRPQNEALLKKHKGDVALVVAELVSLSDNDWYASRHNPPSPPGFLD